MTISTHKTHLCLNIPQIGGHGKKSIMSSMRPTDDTAKGGLTQFYEFFTVILCALKDFTC